MSTSSRFCTNCGAQIAAGAHFCKACGKPIASTVGMPEDVSKPKPTTFEPPPPMPAPTLPGATLPGHAQPPKSKTPLILGCVALIFLGIIGFCVFSFGGLAMLGSGSTTRTPTAVQVFATTIPTIPIVQVPATRTSVVQPLPTATTVSTSASNPLRTALAGCVLVETPNDTGKPVGFGSGTILTPQGHILTNFHVIGDRKAGTFKNKQGLVYIGINPPGLNAKPVITYLAKVIKSDKALDLALLRIVALQDGKPLPTDLKLTPVPIGDSDKVQIADEISVIGFPDLGDETVTFTRGAVSGFLDDPDSIGTWIKTDAGINPGNSGGTAVNKSGELIGIPTRVLFNNDVSGQLGIVRPVNFAKPFIQFAQQDAQSPVSFTFTPWSASPATAPTAQAGAASFAQIVICEDHKDGKPVNPRTTFPSGAKQVVAYWTYKGMTPGQEWGRRWLRDGQVIVDKLSQRWNEDDSGWTSLVLGDGIQIIDPGNYEIRLFIGKTEVQKATFTVQRAGAAVPTPTTQTSGSFSKITIAEKVTEAGEIINPTNTFPAGTKTVHAYFTYLNMKNGDAWGRKWIRDGAVLLEKNETWDGGATGWASYSYFMTDGAALASGSWEFVLYLGGKEVQRAAFTIGRAGAAPPPPASDAINIFFTIQNGSPTGYVIDKQGVRYTPPGYLTISGFHVNVGDRIVITTDQPRFSMLFDCGTTPQIYSPCDFIAGMPSNLPAEIRKMARGTAFLNISRADNWAGTRPGFPSLRYPAEPVLRILLGD